MLDHKYYIYAFPAILLFQHASYAEYLNVTTVYACLSGSVGCDTVRNGLPEEPGFNPR